MFKHGKFDHKPEKPGAIKSTGEKSAQLPAKSAPMQEKGKAPQQDVGEKHVTETHPGMTQPHPITGVHAVHAHHKGGGKYMSHTHMEDGTVESKEHNDAADMHAHVQSALPSDGQESGREPGSGGEDYTDVLSGIGGE